LEHSLWLVIVLALALLVFVIVSAAAVGFLGCRRMPSHIISASFSILGATSVFRFLIYACALCLAFRSSLFGWRSLSSSAILLQIIN